MQHAILHETAWPVDELCVCVCVIVSMLFVYGQQDPVANVESTITYLSE